MLWKALKQLLACGAVLSGLALSQSPSVMPIVDLGYELHQASFFNVRPQAQSYHSNSLMYVVYWGFL